MTTITIKNSTPNWDKTNFSNDGDLLDYLMGNFNVGQLKKIDEQGLTEKRKEKWDSVDKMSENDFIDIR